MFDCYSVTVVKLMLGQTGVCVCVDKTDKQECVEPLSVFRKVNTNGRLINILKVFFPVTLHEMGALSVSLPKMT